MTTLLHIADRLLNRPLLLLPDKASTILSVLADRLGSDLDVGSIDASRFVGSRRKPDGSTSLARRANGVALIPVLGSLVNRGAWIDASSGLTSYEGLSAQIAEAAADPAVKAIVLDIDSPGGEAGGMVGLASAIRAARLKKRVVAVVNDMAASAAYGIASAAHEIIISETSILGSIGVILLHLDRSGEMAARGVRPTMITAGAHKADGNSYEPLSKEVRAGLQGHVNAVREQFLSVVEAGRGSRLSAAKARATEARVYLGQAAIAAGLADRIGTLDEVIANLSKAATSGPASPARIAASSPSPVPVHASLPSNDVALAAAPAAVASAATIVPMPSAPAAVLTPPKPMMTPNADLFAARRAAALGLPASAAQVREALPVGRSPTSAEILESRRQAVSRASAVVEEQPFVAVGVTYENPGPTRWTTSQILEARRNECARLQHEATARSRRGGSTTSREPMPTGRSGTVDDMYARRAATVDRLRRIGDG